MENKGGLFQIADRGTDLAVLGILWFITSLPIITIGASSTALYYAASKSVRFGEGKPVKEYFRAWKANAVQGCVSTVIYLLAAGAAVSAVMVTGKIWLALIPATAAAGTAVYFFPVLSRFTLSAVQCFQVSVFLMVRYPIQTGSLLITLGLCGAVTGIFPFLLPVLYSFYTYYSTFYLEKIFREYMNPEMAERGAWYAE